MSDFTIVKSDLVWIKCADGSLLNVRQVVNFYLTVYTDDYGSLGTAAIWQLCANVTGTPPSDLDHIVINSFGADGEDQAEHALYQLSQMLPGQMLDADLDFNGEREANHA